MMGEGQATATHGRVKMCDLDSDLVDSERSCLCLGRLGQVGAVIGAR